MEQELTRLIRLSVFLVLLISTSLLVMQQWRWSLGFFLGAIWMMVSLLLMTNILKVATLKKSSKKLTFFILLKFPVLYLLAYVLLISKVFPVMSLFIGSLTILLTFGGMSLWPRHT